MLINEPARGAPGALCRGGRGGSGPAPDRCALDPRHRCHSQESEAGQRGGEDGGPGAEAVASPNSVTLPSHHEWRILPTLPLASPGSQRQRGKGRRHVVTQTWLCGPGQWGRLRGRRRRKVSARCGAAEGDGRCGPALRKPGREALRDLGQRRSHRPPPAGARARRAKRGGVRQREGITGKEQNVPEAVGLERHPCTPLPGWAPGDRESQQTEGPLRH